MKKPSFLSFIGFLLLSLSVPAAEIVTATISITNTAGTTNGQAITVNGNVRTWTNSVYSPASMILTNETSAGAATNLFNQVASFPYPGLTLSRTTSTNVVLKSAPDFTLTVALSAGWGKVDYVTNNTTAATVVRVPPSVETNPVRTNVASGLALWLGDNSSTNPIPQSAPSFAQFLGTSNSQTIYGNKTIVGTLLVSNRAGIFEIGVISATNFTGRAGNLTNGNWYTGAVTDAVYTNGAFYGAQVFWGSVDIAGGGLSFAGYASNIGADDEKFTIHAETSAYNVYLGSMLGLIDGVTAHQGYFSNSLYAGSITTSNLTVAGPSTFSKTNNFPAGSDIAFGRYANTSLANGGNAAVLVGTNVFMEVSGPSAAFSIAGLNGAPNRDGKLVVIVNQTGFDMTIAHQSGTDPTAANRIITMTGADRTTTGNGSWIGMYSSAASRWIEIAFNP